MRKADLKRLRKKAAQKRAWQERVDAAKEARDALPWYASPVNWLFARLGERRQRWLIRVKFAVQRAHLNPAPGPAAIGKKGRYEKRVVEIELGFLLHGDGHVIYRNRWGQNERITDDRLIGMVHREYRMLVESAQEQLETV